MKRFFLLASALVCSFTSCDVEEEVEEAINNSIEINQMVEEEFTLPTVVE